MSGEITRLKVILHQPDGESQVVEPGHVLPIEFFRVNGFLLKHFVSNPENTETEKQTLAKQLLQRINSRPWKKFDETFVSIEPENKPFCGFSLHVHVLNTDHYEYGKELEKVANDTLYYFNTCKQ